MVWSAAPDQAPALVWQIIGFGGPSLLALLLACLVARAIGRQGRYRVAGAFDEKDREAVRQALRDAEARTVGEILPVVVERSDPHPGADWLAALCSMIFGSSLLAVWLPWSVPPVLLLLQLAMGAAGVLLARSLPDFKRLFIFEERATAVAGEQAFQEFYANGLHKTTAATGVLLFVSLLERRVIVLADEGIDREVDAGFWAGVDAAVLEGIRRGSLRDGLIDGIRRAGDLLGERFPVKPDDVNEIPDRLIVRDE